MKDNKIPKKILISLNNSRISGIERFVLLLAKYLDKKKYKMTVAVPSKGQICSFLNKLDIDYFIFNNTNENPYNCRGIFNILKYFIKKLS